MAKKTDAQEAQEDVKTPEPEMAEVTYSETEKVVNLNGSLFRLKARKHMPDPTTVALLRQQGVELTTKQIPAEQLSLYL